MAKKGGAIQLVVDVDNEEDWEKLVDRTGLIIVDIYSDWCGPCSGMTGNLRKIKLEIGGDLLTLATAKSDNIQCLERFRNKSQPTWMFISERKMIRLLFGANAPRLMNIVIEEINKEKRHYPREGIDFHELTDEEQERVDAETRIREEREEIEREQRERAINQHRDDVVENLIEHMREYNYILIWPHVTNEGIAKIFDAIKETCMTVAGKPIKIQLKDEDLKEILYFCTWEYTEEELEELKNEEATGLLFQAPMGDFGDDTIEIFLHKIYGSSMAPPGDEDSLAVRLSSHIKGKPKERSTENLDDMETEEEEPPEILIPGIFVPENDQCKVLGMRILFPQVTQRFDLPEPEPIPPQYIIAFDAFKRNEVLQLATEYPAETVRLGFFTSAEAESAQLIAKTPEQYNRITVPPVEAKLVIQVSKKKSEPLLSFSLLGPMYVSPNAVVGEKECAIFFPEGYEIEPEEIVEEVKKKKKRGRGSQTTMETDELIEDELSEEELEVEEEEEVEEEDADDDDDIDIFGDFQPD